MITTLEFKCLRDCCFSKTLQLSKLMEKASAAERALFCVSGAKFAIVKAQLIYCYKDGRCFISYVYSISWDSQCDCIRIIFSEF